MTIRRAIRRAPHRSTRGVTRGVTRLAMLLGLVAVGAGCFGLSEDEQARYSFFHESSLGSYERGEYVRALHQANMALELQDEDVPMQLVRAFCLLKLGKAQANGPMVEESLEIFKELVSSGEGDDDFRVHMGLGSAHLARALQYDHEIPGVERRLESEFLSSEGRAAEKQRLERLIAARLDHLRSAEKSLRRVLATDLQHDNLYASMDLILVLNSLGDREDDALELAQRALVLLDESSRFTRNSLDRNKRLSPSARIDLQRRIDSNREKERLLRDMIATISFNRGDIDGFLAQIAIMEQRGLAGEVQLYNRAVVREQVGEYDGAAQDLEAFLRMRVRRMTYEQDKLAPEVFERIEALKARHAEQSGS